MLKVRSKDGTQIAYTKSGSGAALVLVDGAFCFRDNGLTPKLAPVLAQSFSVVAYDRRGRGESGDAPEYDAEREVDDLEAVIGVAGDNPFILGSSSGGELVIRALARGVAARKVALYEVPYVGADPNCELPPVGSKAELRDLLAAGNRDGAASYFMTRVFGAPRFVVTLMKVLARTGWAKNRSVAHTLPYDLELMRDWTVPPSARTLDLPVLVMSGQKAPVKLRRAADALAESLGAAERCILPGASHNPKPDVMTGALVDFFK